MSELGTTNLPRFSILISHLGHQRAVGHVTLNSSVVVIIVRPHSYTGLPLSLLLLPSDPFSPPPARHPPPSAPNIRDTLNTRVGFSHHHRRRRRLYTHTQNKTPTIFCFNGHFKHHFHLSPPQTFRVTTRGGERERDEIPSPLTLKPMIHCAKRSRQLLLSWTTREMIEEDGQGRRRRRRRRKTRSLPHRLLFTGPSSPQLCMFKFFDPDITA